MATIRDVAKISGVSPATVSFVLNNGPRPVSPATRARVEDAIRRLNYQPSAAARSLARKRMNNIGVLFGRVESRVVTNSYASGVLGGILYEAERHKIDVLLVTQSWDREDASVSTLRDRRSDGYILLSPSITSPIVAEVGELGVPFVVIAGRPAERNEAPLLEVDVDNALGARLATQHLLDLGHRRIAHLVGTDNHYSAHARCKSFLETLHQAGLTVRDDYIVQGSYDGSYGDANQEAVKYLLGLPEPPTAIFCANDAAAAAALETIPRLGVSVPADLSIVGFDDVPTSAQQNPPLTTVRQPLERIGREATRLLLEWIEGDEPEPTYHLLPPELIIRASTAPPRT